MSCERQDSAPELSVELCRWASATTFLAIMFLASHFADGPVSSDTARIHALLWRAVTECASIRAQWHWCDLLELQPKTVLLLMLRGSC